MIQQKLSYDIPLFEAPITIYFFVDANTYINQEFIYCWEDELHFMLKTFQMRQICNWPCISLFFLALKAVLFLERAGIFSRWTDTDFFFWLRFAQDNDVRQLFLYFVMIGQVVMVRMSLNLIPKNVVNLNRAMTGRSCLTVIVRDSLFTFWKK